MVDTNIKINFSTANVKAIDNAKKKVQKLQQDIENAHQKANKQSQIKVSTKLNTKSIDGVKRQLDQLQKVANVSGSSKAAQSVNRLSNAYQGLLSKQQQNASSTRRVNAATKKLSENLSPTVRKVRAYNKAATEAAKKSPIANRLPTILSKTNVESKKLATSINKVKQSVGGFKQSERTLARSRAALSRMGGATPQVQNLTKSIYHFQRTLQRTQANRALPNIRNQAQTTLPVIRGIGLSAITSSKAIDNMAQAMQRYNLASLSTKPMLPDARTIPQRIATTPALPSPQQIASQHAQSNQAAQYDKVTAAIGRLKQVASSFNMKNVNTQLKKNEENLKLVVKRLSTIHKSKNKAVRITNEYQKTISKLNPTLKKLEGRYSSVKKRLDRYTKSLGLNKKAQQQTGKAAEKSGRSLGVTGLVWGFLGGQAQFAADQIIGGISRILKGAADMADAFQRGTIFSPEFEVAHRLDPDGSKGFLQMYEQEKSKMIDDLTLEIPILPSRLVEMNRQLEKALPASVDQAIALEVVAKADVIEGDVDIDSLADGLASTESLLPGTDLTHAMQSISRVAADTKLNIGSTAKSFGRILPYVKQLAKEGATTEEVLDDAAAIVAIMGNPITGKAGSAGIFPARLLGNILQSDIIDKLEEAGEIDIFDESGNPRGAIDALDQVSDYINQIEKQYGRQAAIDLSFRIAQDKRGLEALSAYRTAPEELKKQYKDGVDTGLGEARFQHVATSFKSGMTSIRAEIERMQAAFLQGFGSIQPLLDIIREFTRDPEFIELIQMMGKAIKDELIPAVKFVLVYLKGFLKFLKNNKGLLSVVARAIVYLTGALYAIGAIAPIIALLIGLSFALSTVSVAVLAPIAAIVVFITVLVLAAAAMNQVLDTIPDFNREIQDMSHLMENTDDVFNAMKNSMEEYIGPDLSGFIASIIASSYWLSELGDVIGIELDKIGKDVDAFFANAGSFIDGAFSGVGDGISGDLSAVYDELYAFGDNITNFFSNLGSGSPLSLGENISMDMNAIYAELDAVSQAIQEFFTTVGNRSFSGIGEGISTDMALIYTELETLGMVIDNFFISLSQKSLLFFTNLGMQGQDALAGWAQLFEAMWAFLVNAEPFGTFVANVQKMYKKGIIPVQKFYKQFKIMSTFWLFEQADKLDVFIRLLKHAWVIGKAVTDAFLKSLVENFQRAATFVNNAIKKFAAAMQAAAKGKFAKAMALAGQGIELLQEGLDVSKYIDNTADAVRNAYTDAIHDIQKEEEKIGDAVGPLGQIARKSILDAPDMSKASPYGDLEKHLSMSGIGLDNPGLVDMYGNPLIPRVEPVAPSSTSTITNNINFELTQNIDGNADIEEQQKQNVENVEKMFEDAIVTSINKKVVS